MVSDIIKIGCKIDIRILEQIARAEKTGESPKTFKSQVLDVRDNGDIEIAMPFEGSKIILLPLELRYEFLFLSQAGMYKANGHIKERYKADNRYMLLITLNTNLEKFQRREFYRLECLLDMSVFKITKEQSEYAEIDEIFSEIRDEDFYKKEIPAVTRDISGGGVRFVADVNMEDQKYLLMNINLKSSESQEEISMVGRILKCTKLDNVPGNRYEYRVGFLVKDKKVCESIVRYVFSEERKNRKNGKG